MTLISLGLLASGAGVTIHFLMGGQLNAAALSGLATTGIAVLTLEQRFGLRMWSRLGNRLDEEPDSVADWLFDNAKLLTKRAWWNAIADFRAQYNKSLSYRYRNYSTEGIETRGPFALNLEKLFVPLRLRPESFGQISPQMIGRPDSGGSWSIWQFLVALKTQPAFDRLVILGAPGSGKTTLLRHLTLIFAKGTHRQYNRALPSYIPVLIYLREVRELIEEDRSPSLQTLIEQQIKLDGITPPSNWFTTRLRQGRCLIMFDGLDEVADLGQRRKVSKWITQQMRIYRRTPFIIASRPFGYRDAPLEGATTLEIKPFNLKQMQQFVQNWYLQTETVRHSGKSDRSIHKAAETQAINLIHSIRENSSLEAMSLNPLLLTMIATIHAYHGALSSQWVELYAEICDALLGRRQGLKGIPDVLTAGQKKQVLQTLAFKLMKRRRRTFNLFEGKALIEKQLVKVTEGELTAPDFIQQIEHNSGLLVARHPAVYEFADKGFQEYLSVIEIQTFDLEDELIRNINDPWWERTILFYASQAKDSSNLVWSAIIHQPSQLEFANSIFENSIKTNNYLKEIFRSLKNHETRLLEDSDRVLPYTEEEQIEDRETSRKEMLSSFQIHDYIDNFFSQSNSNIQREIFIANQLYINCINISHLKEFKYLKTSYYRAKFKLDILCEGSERFLFYSNDLLEDLYSICKSAANCNILTSKANKLNSLKVVLARLQQIKAIQLSEQNFSNCARIQDIISKWSHVLNHEIELIDRQNSLAVVANPYVVGAPVKGKLFVGRDDILTRIEELWMPQDQLPSIILYGHRRMGKTSILQNLNGRFGTHTQLIDFNMQRVGMLSGSGKSGTGELLHNLALSLYDTLPENTNLTEPNEESFTQHTPYIAFDRFLKKLNKHRNQTRYIITVDEFELVEHLINQGQLEQRILEYWRSLIVTYPWFIMAFAGLHSLQEMTQDYWNPLFGNVRAIQVSFLSQKAAERLITNPTDDFPLDYDRDAIQEIYRLTGGQPYLIQLICHSLISRFNHQRFEEGQDLEPRLTLADVETIITSPDFYRDGNAYFSGVWSQSQEEHAEAQATILQMLSQHPNGLSETELLQTLPARNPASESSEIETVDTQRSRVSNTSQALALLQKHDVIHLEQGHYRFVVELMRRWVQQQS